VFTCSIYVCFLADKEILDVFTSFDDLPIEAFVDNPPSIVIMGGPCSSRVAVANRLLGRDVLPVPRDDTTWHTLQFVDTECVISFRAAAVNMLWSWFGSVPLENVELDTDESNTEVAEVDSVSSGSFRSEFMQTAPVVNILMSHPVLRAGCQVVVCGNENESRAGTVQLPVDAISIIVFLVSADGLSDQVPAAVIIPSTIALCPDYALFNILFSYKSIRMKSGILLVLATKCMYSFPLHLTYIATLPKSTLTPESYTFFC